MKVQLVFSVERDNAGYNGTSVVFEWPYDVLPVKGDLIDVSSIEEEMGIRIVYDNKKAEQYIGGELIRFTEKSFGTDENKNPVITLWCGELPNESL